MTDKPRDVTDSELSVLDVLWAQPDATIREITEAIYEATSPSAHATVQKLLERLEAKDCVTRDRSGFAHRFRASIERGELIDRQLEAVAEKLCEGSLTPLLLHLAGRTNLTAEERKQLRKLIASTQSRGRAQ